MLKALVPVRLPVAVNFGGGNARSSSSESLSCDDMAANSLPRCSSLPETSNSHFFFVTVFSIFKPYSGSGAAAPAAQKRRVCLQSWSTPRAKTTFFEPKCNDCKQLRRAKCPRGCCTILRWLYVPGYTRKSKYINWFIRIRCSATLRCPLTALNPDRGKAVLCILCTRSLMNRLLLASCLKHSSPQIQPRYIDVIFLLDFPVLSRLWLERTA